MLYDEMWPGGPKYLRSQGAFRPGTDSILLAAFAGTGPAKTACDLGCGAGVIAILMAWENTGLTVDGVEIQDTSAEEARNNVHLNGLEDRVRILQGDLRCHRGFLTAGAYDVVVSNPPYFAEGRGKSAPEKSRATAREERLCTLEDLAIAGAYLTRWGGSFVLVHKPERLAEVICALTQRGLEPKRLRLIQHRAMSTPNLFLLSCRRGGNPGLTVEAPLVLTGEDGLDTDEIKHIYHRP